MGNAHEPPLKRWAHTSERPLMSEWESRESAFKTLKPSPVKEAGQAAAMKTVVVQQMRRKRKSEPQSMLVHNLLP